MKFLLAVLMLFTLNVSADVALSETSYNFAKVSIGRGKPTLLQFGSKDCSSCVTMGEFLYEIKDNNPSYNINYINIRKDKRVIEKFNITMIPMQIIYDKNGKEVFRNVGLIEEEELNELFKTYKF